ncbi:VWD domain-containing protein [Catellatospora sp. NPDC049111]|uniref:VWD domain-containing protein n=1 Tax=Catellatospora sp. NPDC049111 TaxID=3155271 RepID=UPI0033FB6E62
MYALPGNLERCRNSDKAAKGTPVETVVRTVLASVLLGLVAAFITAVPARAGDRAEDSGLRLAVAPAQPVFRPGDPVVLKVTVTNRAHVTCRLADTADGTITMMILRDSVATAAVFAPVTYADGLSGMVALAARDVAPGQSLAFAMTGDDGPARRALRAVTAVPGDGGVAAYWPVSEPGRYTVTAIYEMPATAGACAGRSQPAAADFTVSGGPASGMRWWWWWAAAALLVTLLAGGGVCVLRRRRGSAGAMVLLLVSVASLVQQPTPAHAKIVIDDLDKPENLGFVEAVEACISDIRTRLGADAIGVMPALDDPNFTVHITPTKGSSESTHFDKRTEVKFNPKPAGTYNGETTARHGCSEFFHEMVHAHDNATDQLDSRPCKTGADGKPTRNGAQVQEVSAVRAENHYRASHGLPQRTTYSGLPLPPGKDPTRASVLSDCAQKEQDKQKDKPPTHSDLPGGSNGDPHLLTFDQRRYDFQAVGEFLLAKSGDIEVQVRQAPVPGSRLASVNSAVAIRAQTSRLTFALDDGTPQVRLDGSPVETSATQTSLPGGLLLAATDDGSHSVTWPDGTEAELTYLGYWGIRVLLYPATGHQGRFTGLLGNFDGDPDNDLTTADGTTLPADLDHKALYGPFADTWRLTQTASLMDYPTGTDTTTFTDRTFPDRLVSATDLDPAQRATAQRICATLGVSDTVALDECVLDLVLTGQPSFAVSSATLADKIAAAAPRRVPAGTTVRDGTIVSGSISAPDMKVTYPLDTGTATVVRLVDLVGEDGRSAPATLRIGVDGPDASAEPGFTVTSVYQYKVKPGTSNTLSIQRTAGDTGDFSFRVVTAKERRITTAGETVTGRLDVPGRVDLYPFEATTAGPLRLADPTGCDFSVAVVEDNPAPRVYTPAKLCWGISLANLEPGKRYLLIVWSDTAALGNYQFRRQT